MKSVFVVLSFIITSFALTASTYSCPYPWSDGYEVCETLVNRIPIPEGYRRVKTTVGTFQYWLRNLPLKKEKPAVHLYDGREKLNQKTHFAVVDMDVGSKDLQQCADAVIRLRAEYLYFLGSYEKIHFNFTSGDRADFTKWMDGYRPIVEGNKVRWTRSETEDSSYHSFRKYLEKVFIYAGSYSLSKELHSVQDVDEMRIGDVFIEGGFPGHAVIVVDMALDEDTGKKLFLLAQSYMPAQDVHILKNPANASPYPWYELDFGEILHTPEWTFDKSDLMRF